MPRKVFISFLGTSKYNECEYVKDDFAYRSCFIQEATYRYLTSQEDWSDNDRILILLTQQAEEKNWKDNGHKDRKTGDIIQSKGLNSILQDIAGQTVIETIKGIPEGKDEAEIYSIFEKVYDYLEDGDLLYFDLTHGFRYLPMLILVLGNYAKFLKNVSVKSITYGNWEMSANGTRPAPIIDLISLSELQDWTFAAGQFIQSGNVDQLLLLSRAEYLPLLRDSEGMSEKAKQFRRFVDNLRDVVNERQSCRGIEIFKGDSIKKIKDSYKTLSINSSRPYAPIFRKISDTWSGFNDCFDTLNGVKAAQWCFDKKLYLQAATCLEETVLYHCGRKVNLDPINKDERVSLSGAFDYASNSFSHRKKESDYSDDIRRIGKDLLSSFHDIITPFQGLRENVRNDFNHAGVRPDPLSATAIIKKLEKYLRQISNALLGDSMDAMISNEKRFFINLSNHPYANWGKEQIEAAEQCGMIIDMPFPVVPPSSLKNDIEDLCDTKVSEIIKDYPTSSFIHIMGEMNLTYALVQRLKALGYTCLASTTERKVEINENGDKVVHFEFVQFREY